MCDLCRYLCRASVVAREREREQAKMSGHQGVTYNPVTLIQYTYYDRSSRRIMCTAAVRKVGNHPRWKGAVDHIGVCHQIVFTLNCRLALWRNLIYLVFFTRFY